MIYRATHSTTYSYDEPVSICHTEVHLEPRKNDRQLLLDYSLEISPEPSYQACRKDYFGNEVTYFMIHSPHTALSITSRCRVSLPGVELPKPSSTPAWEDAGAARHFEADQFLYESPLVKLDSAFARYALDSFAPRRPLLEAALDLQGRIFKEFKYDQRATTVTTPVEEVLRTRQGVCQDFAHFMIACLRSLGLPARYVSGYLRSGKDSIGAEASHAWASLYCPELGWLDFDPTNNVMPSDGHITLAWGRDYSDVTPVKGVAVGGGEQMIDVSVEVK